MHNGTNKVLSIWHVTYEVAKATHNVPGRLERRYAVDEVIQEWLVEPRAHLKQSVVGRPAQLS